ncbi:hypothetical protein [Crocosphaera sp. XPORK-15E]|uniref:hypothetical protein n=1 Tax=Crocosphaera sp. XPORK-15E TaxID=3110247 RepID=UPI002B207C63|nr:hypothetical protein [Crocosphaera sp. XPORK-15E]MEA5534060.1 hypothetical protein [Crocosphaera sp. XPORK-15E]
MIFVLFETLIVKGAISIGHWIAAHGTGAMASKAGAIVAKSITTQGFANTLAGVTGIALGSSLIVGGVVWGTDKIQALGKGLEALYEGDYIKAAQNFAKLVDLFHIKVEFLPDVIQPFLVEKAGFSVEDASNVAKAVGNLESEIVKFITK